MYKQQVKEGKKTGLFVIKDVVTVDTPDAVPRVRDRRAIERNLHF